MAAGSARSATASAACDAPPFCFSPRKPRCIVFFGCIGQQPRLTSPRLSIPDPGSCGRLRSWCHLLVLITSFQPPPLSLKAPRRFSSSPPPLSSFVSPTVLTHTPFYTLAPPTLPTTAEQSTSNKMDLRVGGKYRLGKKIGSGSFGAPTYCFFFVGFALNLCHV